MSNVFLVGEEGSSSPMKMRTMQCFSNEEALAEGIKQSWKRLLEKTASPVSLDQYLSWYCKVKRVPLNGSGLGAKAVNLKEVKRICKNPQLSF